MRARHYIVGVSRQSDHAMYRLEVYNKEYDKLALNDRVLNQLTNGGYGYSRGVDAFVKRNWRDNSFRLSYSYIKTRRKWGNVLDLAPTEYDITHNISAVAEVPIRSNLRIGGGYRYASGKPYTSSTNLYYDKRVPFYQKLDVNITYLYRLFGKMPDVVYLAVSNILGRDNVFDYVYSADYLRRTPVRSSMLRSVYFGISLVF